MNCKGASVAELFPPLSGAHETLHFQGLTHGQLACEMWITSSSHVIRKITMTKPMMMMITK